MSAVLTRRRPSRARDRDREGARSTARQESLFAGGAAAAVAPAPPRAEPAVGDALGREPDVEASPARVEPDPGRDRGQPAAVAPRSIAGPTLDEAITALWGDLATGGAVACPACGSSALQPRHSAGAGVVGGRCGACEATLA